MVLNTLLSYSYGRSNVLEDYEECVNDIKYSAKAKNIQIGILFFYSDLRRER